MSRSFDIKADRNIDKTNGKKFQFNFVSFHFIVIGVFTQRFCTNGSYYRFEIFVICNFVQ